MLRSASINSTNREQWPEIRASLAANQIDLLLVSPEQLCSEHFASEVLPAMPLGPGLLVVDEAHCISDWGHDFRPDYRRIVRVIQQLPRNIPLLGTTATANNRVVADVADQLGPGLQLQRGPLVRHSLALQVIRLEDQAERLAWLAEYIPHLPGTGIIYCLTVADCERVADWLQQHGIDVRAYHAQLEGATPEERTATRVELEQMLLENRCKALVATVALGMGYDKPDLGFVVHYQRPGSVVAYYQQVGRAGRAVERALAILLSGREDDEIQEYFIQSAFPTAEQTMDVVRTLERHGEMTQTEILQRVNVSESRVRQVLKLLELDGVVGKEGSRYFRTVNPLVLDLPHQQRVIELRHAELARMQAFVAHQGCLMEFIERELDDPHAAPCNRCANCAGDVVPKTVDPHLVQEAIQYLRRAHRVIEPRLLWKTGGYGGRQGRIPEELRLQPGRALCMWGDAGWGRLVHDGKYVTGHFSDELVVAVAEMITDHWRPDPLPSWVTAVPSLRHPDLVPDVARRLAARLGLPFLPVLEKVLDTPAQKTMQNSAQQARNAIDAFRVAGRCPSGSVLLVDDIVDSRWTLTVCGALLRESGSGAVYPVALATAAGGGDLE
jgi:ATP-dependent DNA helicase RecQ